ncbi:MAG: GIY-YIG nuclease family protein [Xanthomonadaceae bacterium]|nr:GIY-YIG nuclease family protein [Xanthomonadaceae bacterium]MDE1965447.1 GIY-YIG nuclease family protein [Xanthomonadaceae bacterium]
MPRSATPTPPTPTATADAVAVPWPAAGQWCLYLIECASGAWYAGITNHLERRYAAHAAGRGARYTRANPPRRLVGWRAFADRSQASRAEAAIKRLPRERKLAYLRLEAEASASGNPPASTA